MSPMPEYKYMESILQYQGHSLLCTLIDQHSQNLAMKAKVSPKIKKISDA